MLVALSVASGTHESRLNSTQRLNVWEIGTLSQGSGTSYVPSLSGLPSVLLSSTWIFESALFGGVVEEKRPLLVNSETSVAVEWPSFWISTVKEIFSLPSLRELTLFNVGIDAMQSLTDQNVCGSLPLRT